MFTIYHHIFIYVKLHWSGVTAVNFIFTSDISRLLKLSMRNTRICFQNILPKCNPRSYICSWSKYYLPFWCINGEDKIQSSNMPHLFLSHRMALISGWKADFDFQCCNDHFTNSRFDSDFRLKGLLWFSGPCMVGLRNLPHIDFRLKKWLCVRVYKR